MNIGPLTRSPDDLPSARAVNKHPGIEEHRAQLLELRTESGTLYVCPSQWQRIRFLWTFRHFHVLSLQILSRHDQRLIERLSRSALVKPPLPVARDAVFGVIEKVSTKSTESARRVVTQKTERVRASLQEKPDMPDSPRPGLPDHERLFFEDPGPGYFQSVNDSESISIHKAVARMYGATDQGRVEGFRQWRALGMLIAVCIVVILARVYGVSLLARTAQMRKPPTVSAPMGQAAIGVSPPTVPLPGVENPKRTVTTLKPAPEPTLPEPTLVIARKSAPVPSGSAGSITDSNSAGALSESAPTSPSGATERVFLSELPQGQFVEPVVSDPNLVGEVHLRALIDADGSVKEMTVVSSNPNLESAPTSPSGASERLFLSELPQGQFVEPVVPDPNLVGEVHLRALIDADGSVKEVTVVSGNPKLAEAGMRAVRRWRYSPGQAPGGSSEGETLIRMRFFGSDAVSITSVAR